MVMQVVPGGSAASDDLYTVETEEYLEVLEDQYDRQDTGPDITVDDLPDRIEVDRRGYAPDVADEIGQDYLEDTIFIFDQQQEGAGLVWEEFSFMDELLDDIYANRGFLQKATGSQPVSIDVHFDYTRTDFEVRALLESEDVKERLEKAMDAKERAQSIEGSQVKDGSYLEDVQGDIRSMLDEFGDLKKIELQDQLGRHNTDRFAFDKPGMEGYMFHGDPPTCIVTSGSASDWQDMYLDFYTIQEGQPDDVNTVLQELYEAGEYRVDEDAAIEDLKWLGGLILQEKEIDAEPGNISFYKKLKEHRDDLPGEWHAVRDLVKNGDMELDDSRDSVKLYYIEPANAFSEDVLERVRNMVLDEDAFRERFSDLEQRVTREEDREASTSAGAGG